MVYDFVMQTLERTNIRRDFFSAGGYASSKASLPSCIACRWFVRQKLKQAVHTPNHGLALIQESRGRETESGSMQTPTYD
jgi:hypothetical protein